MASIEEALFIELKTDSAIDTKTTYAGGHRIFPIEIPKNHLNPVADYYITYFKPSYRKITSLDLENDIFQINAIAPKYLNAINLKDDIIRVLERFKGSLGGKRNVMSVVSTNQAQLKSKTSELFYIAIIIKIKHLGDNI